MNRFLDAGGEELRPQIRLLAIGAVISLALLAGSLGVMLGGINAPGIPQLPSISPTQTSVPGFPSGLPTKLPAGMPTSLPSGFPAGLIPTDLPSLPGGNP